MTEYKPLMEDLSQYKNDEIGFAEKIEPWEDPEWKAESLVKIEVLDYNDECFLLKNVLSNAECSYYITKAEETGFCEIPEAKKSYRGNKRMLMYCDGFRDLIWQRIRPFLDDITIEGDPHRIHVHGPERLLQGTWQPRELNSLLRLCKYVTSEHFGPHFDGHFVTSATVRSMKTFMIYLNDSFTGGTTNLIDECQTLYMNEQGKYCAEEKNILYRVNPEPGMAIIFNHHRLHEGEALGSGVKYILRTDIMYERVSGPSLDPRESEALQIAQEAERLEAQGECMAAMELYRKAFKMSPSLAQSYGCPD